MLSVNCRFWILDVSSLFACSRHRQFPTDCESQTRSNESEYDGINPERRPCCRDFVLSPTVLWKPCLHSAGVRVKALNPPHEIVISKAAFCVITPSRGFKMTTLIGLVPILITTWRIFGVVVLICMHGKDFEAEQAHPTLSRTVLALAFCFTSIRPRIPCLAWSVRV